MSETVHYKGKLTKVEKVGEETLEQQCQRLLGNKDRPSYFDSYAEMLEDEYYKKYVIIDDNVYSVSYQSIDPDADLFSSSIDQQGDVTFEVKYYNGGCSFNEAIEKALQNKQ